MSSIERCFFLFGVSLIKEVLLYIQKHFRLVTSFEAITANLVDQENFTTFEKVGEDITIKAERVRVHFRECYSYFYTHFLLQNSTTLYKTEGRFFIFTVPISKL